MVCSACAANPAALVVSRHRVVRSDGALGDYRWGLTTGSTLLDVSVALIAGMQLDVLGDLGDLRGAFASNYNVPLARHATANIVSGVA